MDEAYDFLIAALGHVVSSQWPKELPATEPAREAAAQAVSMAASTDEPAPVLLEKMQIHYAQMSIRERMLLARITGRL